MLKNILVPLDASALAARAIPYATTIAQQTGARVILIRATLAHAGPGSSVIDAQFSAVEQAEAELAPVTQKLRKQDIDVESHVYYSEAASAIVDAARFQHADLIVMSTHGRSGLGRWIYGSVADQVIRHTHLPVLLVPATCERAWGTGEIQRILVTLDGSSLAEEALPPARALARAFDAELLLARIVEPTAYALAEAAGTPTGFDASERLAEARGYLDRTAEDLADEDIRVQGLALIGQAPSTVANLAREHGADLVVMASHGRGGLARLVMGSVATGLVHRSSVPLMVVVPESVQEAAARPESLSPEMEPAFPPVELTLSGAERQLLREGLQLLRSSQRQDHLVRPLEDLLRKIEHAEPASELRTTASVRPSDDGQVPEVRLIKGGTRDN